MIISIQGYVRRGKSKLRGWLSNPKVHGYLRVAIHFLIGFCLSAASLFQVPLPLAMALVCASNGWSAVLVALGGSAGYLFFWGAAGQQSVLWVVTALTITLLLPERWRSNQTKLLMPALAGLIVSASGVVFQAWLSDTATVWQYMVRVATGAATTWLFGQMANRRNPIVDWLACGVGVLALAQIAPTPYLSLGVIAAGALAVAGAFPAAALAGLALDLAGITSVSMTAVMCAAYFVRFLPRYPKWSAAAAPGLVYILIAVFVQKPDLVPLPGLILGGVLGVFLPVGIRLPNRRGETGAAQVRLEMAAGALAQTEQLLLEVQQPPVDEDALVTRAAEQACGGCPCRRGCKDSRRIAQLPAAILHKPLLTTDELPVVCRKGGRFLAQLHRSQEQLRSICADRERQKEYQSAVVQQYRFLAEYLQDLSDSLAKRTQTIYAYYEPQVQIYGNRPAADNGDRCVMFVGTQCRYYVILCDGMGTGMGAVQEGRAAVDVLRRLLTAGYPAEYALQSINSLCALRNRAGAVTIDLLELSLETGKGMLYKWGAAPSYLVSGIGAEKIGTASPPPGLSVTDSRAATYRISLRRGETLLMVSDGVGEEDALRCCLKNVGCAPGELARSLLNCSRMSGEDDATVVTVRIGAK